MSDHIEEYAYKCPRCLRQWFQTYRNSRCPWCWATHCPRIFPDAEPEQREAA